MNRFFDEYGEDQKFVVFAFPCRQFGSQEYKEPERVKAFVKSKGVKFPVLALGDVKGPNAHPAYKYLTSVLPGDIVWNFRTKFLINRDGVPVKRIDEKGRKVWETVEEELKKVFEANPDTEEA